MVSISTIAKRAGLGVVAAAATSGVAYGAERLAVARARRRDDPDAGRSFVPQADGVRVLDSHDGGTISVLTKGSGPPLVLCHGVTLSVRTWAKQFDSLPVEGFEVLAFDSRGHGESRCGESGHSVDNLAVDLRTVLETLDVRDAVLVGHSMGGIAVQAFAARHPDVARERVRGLVLMSTLARTMFSGAARLQAVVERLANGVPDVGGLMGHRNLGFLLARIGFGREPAPSHVELVRQMIESCDPETTRLATRALLGLDLVPDIGRIDLPTLVLSGTADVITPPAESRRIAATIPGARLETFEGAGHMLMLERADEVDRLIVDFARTVGAGRPRREVV
ncbi:MAG TPA: alpha/beta fold hydrolase [Acidimicrobiia bacterium]|nr:alpha/beta fold hydrolase [Acidimicrobiia bacterium]